MFENLNYEFSNGIPHKISNQSTQNSTKKNNSKKPSKHA